MTNVYRPVGQTQALSVTGSSHAAVTLTTQGNDQANFVALVNLGSVGVAVTISQAGIASTLPIDGTPGSFMLPPIMQQPILLPLPSGTGGTAPSITAIGVSAGPSLIYATPVTAQQ